MTDAQDNGNTFELFIERFGPGLIALSVTILNAFWLRFVLLEHTDWPNRLLDRVIQAAAVSSAFWGVAITLLLGMSTQQIVQTLRRLGYSRLLVSYFSEAFLASSLLLILSVLLEPLCHRASGLAVTSIWFGLGSWALLTALRTYRVMMKLLARLD